MEIWRKPDTAEWYYESAQPVAEVTVDDSAWVDEMYVFFDATKDKSSYRRTTMRVNISAKEVTALYRGLIKGRKLKREQIKKEKESAIKEKRENLIIEVNQWKEEARGLKQKLADEASAVDAILGGQPLNQKCYESVRQRLNDHYGRLGYGTRREAEVIRNQKRLEEYVRTHGTK